MKRNSRLNNRGAGKKTFAVVVDGETEMWYLQMLKRNEPECIIVLKPELPKKKSLKEQYQLVVENSIYFDKCIWILDLDTIVKESKEAKVSKEKCLSELNRYLGKLKGNKKVQVLVNMPCLEFWFLLHFTDTGKYYNQCGPIEKELKKSIPLKDYEKTQKYFVNSAADIYKRLKPHLRTAISNAKKRGDFNINEPETSKSEMFKIFDILNIMGIKNANNRA